jgi:hypothetical protein
MPPGTPSSADAGATADGSVLSAGAAPAGASGGGGAAGVGGTEGLGAAGGAAGAAGGGAAGVRKVSPRRGFTLSPAGAAELAGLASRGVSLDTGAGWGGVSSGMRKEA